MHSFVRFSPPLAHHGSMIARMPGEDDIGNWNGLLAGRGTPTELLEVEMPIQPSPRGGSGTFLAACKDGRQWWVKPPNNPQGGEVIVTEYVVGRLGRLISAPVCEVAIALIPEELAGWEFRPGMELEPGYASASQHVEDVVEHRALRSRTDDDNARRHVGVYAVYDWCWGGDAQWLYAQSDDQKIHSHDHGWYLPPIGPDWTRDELLGQVNVPHTLTTDAAGVSAEAVTETAHVLESVSRAAIADVLRRVPTSWPVTTEELEALGYFLERRAPEVAQRLRGLVPAGGQ